MFEVVTGIRDDQQLLRREYGGESAGELFLSIAESRRWMGDYLATIDAATFSFSVPESSLPSQPSVSPPGPVSMRDTKFS